MRYPFTPPALVSRLLLAVALLLTAACRLPAQHLLHPEVPICGNEPTGQGLAPGEKGLIDRFNRPWRPSKRLIAYQASRRTFASTDCGGFRVDFGDVINSTRTGFDDRTPISHPVLGSTTLGELRQRTVCEVFSYIGNLIVMRGSPDVLFTSSEGDGSGALASASPLFAGTTSSGFIGGGMFDHITTGVDPSPNPGGYDAFITFDFGYDWNSDWNNIYDHRYDLFSVALHEITHTLGFFSLIGSGGASRIGAGYSLYDRAVRDATLRPLINPVTLAYQGSATDPVSNVLLYLGDLCPEQNPVYSAAPYRSGSSMSHFDQNRSGIHYVMHPSSSGGPNREYTPAEKQVLCDLGYTLTGGLCAHCAPRAVDDYGATEPAVEVCVDVLANDISQSGAPLVVDPASVRIEAGGGVFRINGPEICYTPPAGFVGVARIRYAANDGTATGNTALLRINVTRKAPPPPTGRRDYDVWYFGTGAGMGFAGGIAYAITSGPTNQLEGVATICSRTTGRLLMATDGLSVWDSTLRFMRNGNGLPGIGDGALMGNMSSTQSALIVPKPGDTSIYYIFTTGAGDYMGPAASNNGLRYSIVDMRGFFGRGEVMTKNINLLASSTEKLTATRHCNKRDYWVVGHEWGSDAFYAYLVTPQGITDTVVSRCGSESPRNDNDPTETGYNCMGAMKISPNGRLLASALQNQRHLELCDFDNATGVVSNARIIDDGDSAFYYGVSFSPDNSKLYAGGNRLNPSHPVVLAQFDLARGSDAASISNSRQWLLTDSTVNHQVGSLQLAPDGRIYVALGYAYQLGVIDRPNLPGLACNYIHEGFDLAGKLSLYGLPNCIESDIFGSQVDSSQLRITKQVSDSTPVYGDTIAYTLSVCNVSCGDVADVVIEDHLPDGLLYIEGMDTYPHHTFDTVHAGDCRTVVVRAVVTPLAPLGEPVTNCFDVVSSTPGYGFLPLDSNCATIIIHGTDIGVVKEVNDTVPSIGDTVAYTITVTNYGPDRATGIRVMDLLPLGLLYVSHSVAGGTGAYDPVTGEITLDDLAIGSSATVTLRCRVEQGAPTEIVNCASLKRLDQTDVDITDDRSCATIRPRARRAQLALSKTVDNSAPHFGAPLSYTITLTNNGPQEATNIVARDLLPTGVRYSSHTLSDPSATFDPASGLLTIPRLDSGAVCLLVIHCFVDSTGSGEVVNCAQLLSLNEIDPDSLDNRACVETAPRWCLTPDVAVLATIGREHHTSIYDSLTVPFMMRSMLDAERVRRVRITLSYDSTIVRLQNGNPPEELLRGTLLERWRVLFYTLTPGGLVIELEAPASEYLQGTGSLLNPTIRIYLGAQVGSDIVGTVEFPEDRCIATVHDTGYARLDSLCGLTMRLIEITANRYALGGVRPNPATDVATVGFTLGLDGPTRLDVLDARGNVVATLAEEHLSAGGYEVQWRTRDQPSGLYFLRLVSGDWSRIVPAVVAK